MSEMVDRVADAIRDGISPFVEEMPSNEDIYATARAVIAAMREPTRPMLDAAWGAIVVNGDAPKKMLGHRNKTRSRWYAMVDAAL